MKKIYILTLCALIGALPAAAGSRFHSKKAIHKKEQAKAPAKASEAANPALPSSQTEYSFMDGEWIKVADVTFQYDGRGNIVRADAETEDGLSRETREYDEFNFPTLVLTTLNQGGDNWVNESKRTYIYDPIVHDFYTERMGYDWRGEMWIRNYFCDTNIITRNASGNILTIEKSLPMDDKMIPAYKMEWTYDETTGHASGYSYFSYDAYAETPGWVLYDDQSFANIVWEKTDGQMTAENLMEYTSGTNMIKSCDVYYEGTLDGHIFAEYSEATPGAYTIKETFADPTQIGRTSQLEFIDDFGSFRYTESEYFDEEGNPTPEPVYEWYTENILDARGNLVAERDYESIEGGDPELLRAVKYTYVYDAEGRMESMQTDIFEFAEEEGDEEEYYTLRKEIGGEMGEFVPDSKIEFHYGGNSCVGDIAAPESVDVYNMQGICVKKSATAADVETLPAGLYIIGGEKRIVR